MDYDKTYQAYKDLGMEKKFEQLPDYNQYVQEQKWNEKVRSQRTGDFNQSEDLIKRELVSADWKAPRTDSKGKPVKYPIKEVWEIIRRRQIDGSEWLTSRYMMYGLDHLGNELNIGMVDKEMYNEAIPKYVEKPENPKENPRFKDTKLISVIGRVETRKKYTEPYKPETLQKLYDMRNGGKCNLTVIDESTDHPGFGAIPFEHFKMPFDELWSWASTPRTKLDRSYGDNLDNSHIG